MDKIIFGEAIMGKTTEMVTLEPRMLEPTTEMIISMVTKTETVTETEIIKELL